MGLISGFFPEYHVYLQSFFAASTLVTKFCHLKVFNEWFDKEIPEGLPGLTLRKCVRYVDFLLRSGYDKATAVNMLCTVRNMWSWLYLEEKVEGNPWRDVPSLRLERESKTKPFTRDELLKFFDAEEKKDFRALWETFYTNGARMSEVRKLKMKDLDFSDGWMHCRVKGGKTRILPLGERAIAALKAHLDGRTLGPEDWVFPPHHKSKRNQPLGVSCINDRLKALGKRLGFAPERCHSHVFRHTFATLMHKAGANLQDIQEALGHKWVTTTQMYTHVDKHDVKKATEKAQKFHSLERWTG